MLSRFGDISYTIKLNMSRQTSRLDAKKVVSTPNHSKSPSKVKTTVLISYPKFTFSQNSELLTLTYGALVSQMLKEIENPDDVNKQLERIGYNMGVRLIEDFLARTTSNRCMEMRETADKLQQAFR